MRDFYYLPLLTDGAAPLGGGGGLGQYGSVGVHADTVAGLTQCVCGFNTLGAMPPSGERRARYMVIPPVGNMARGLHDYMRGIVAMPAIVAVVPRRVAGVHGGRSLTN